MKIFVDRFYKDNYWGHVGKHTTKQERDDFKKYMKQKYNIDFVTIFEATPHIEFNVKCQTIQDINNFKLNKSKMDSEFTLFFDGIDYDINASYEELYLENMPKELIEFGKISLNCENGEYSLHNIHKYVKCDYLQICNISNIKSHILGLMLIPQTTFIDIHYTYSWTQLDTNWLLIVKRHLINNRDILECQEELIIKGYKDYAKI
jgi:hypothetical protein